MNKVWQIQATDYPSDGSLAEKIKFWLGYAILAPSAHNTQPWRVEIEQDVVVIFRDPAFTLQESDGTLRETFLGLGAFIENLVIAAAHWGYVATVKDVAFTVNELKVATIVFKSQPDIEPGAEHDGDLFAGITKRHTNRGHYHKASLSDSDLAALQAVPIDDELIASFITDSTARARIAELVGVTTQMALSVNTMKRELAELTFREEQQKSVGMMVEALTETSPGGIDGRQWTLSHMNPAEHGAYWRETFQESPLHVLIGSRFDGPEAWLMVGRTMERILVKAAALGLAHCISAGPIEVPTVLPELRKELPTEYRPQALFRLGKPQNEAFTRLSTRRSVAEVVGDSGT